MLIGNKQTEELRERIRTLLEKYQRTKDVVAKQLILKSINTSRLNLDKITNNLKRTWRNYNERSYRDKTN